MSYEESISKGTARTHDHLSVSMVLKEPQLALRDLMPFVAEEKSEDAKITKLLALTEKWIREQEYLPSSFDCRLILSERRQGDPKPQEKMVLDLEHRIIKQYKIRIEETWASNKN
jgi:hypothetical protein